MLGKPGAGKSTHAQEISRITQYPIISLGPIFLEEIAKETDIGKELKKYLGNQKTAPDEICNELLKQKLSGLNEYIIEGSPRSIGQAQFLEGILKPNPVEQVFYLNVSNEEAIRRLKLRPRYDATTPEQTLARLRNEEQQNQECKNFYENKGLLNEIDTSKEFSEVSKQIYDLIKLR